MHTQIPEEASSSRILPSRISFESATVAHARNEFTVANAKVVDENPDGQDLFAFLRQPLVVRLTNFLKFGLEDWTPRAALEVKWSGAAEGGGKNTTARVPAVRITGAVWLGVVALAALGALTSKGALQPSDAAGAIGLSLCHTLMSVIFLQLLAAYRNTFEVKRLPPFENWCLAAIGGLSTACALLCLASAGIRVYALTRLLVHPVLLLLETGLHTSKNKLEGHRPLWQISVAVGVVVLLALLASSVEAAQVPWRALGLGAASAACTALWQHAACGLRLAHRVSPLQALHSTSLPQAALLAAAWMAHGGSRAPASFEQILAVIVSGVCATVGGHLFWDGGVEDVRLARGKLIGAAHPEPVIAGVVLILGHVVLEPLRISLPAGMSLLGEVASVAAAGWGYHAAREAGEAGEARKQRLEVEAARVLPSAAAQAAARGGGSESTAKRCCGGRLATAEQHRLWTTLPPSSLGLAATDSAWHLSPSAAVPRSELRAGASGCLHSWRLVTGAGQSRKPWLTPSHYNVALPLGLLLLAAPLVVQVAREYHTALMRDHAALIGQRAYGGLAPSLWRRLTGDSSGARHESGLRWFTYCSDEDPGGDMLKVAVTSAKRQAPELLPHVLQIPELGECPALAWLRARGVPVTAHNLSASSHASPPDGQKAGGSGLVAHLLLDLPGIVSDLAHRDASCNSCLHPVAGVALFTAPHIMFNAPLLAANRTLPALPAPAVLALATPPQVIRKATSPLAVAVINTVHKKSRKKAFRAIADALMESQADSHVQLSRLREVVKLPDSVQWDVLRGRPPIHSPPSILAFHYLRPDFGLQCASKHRGTILELEMACGCLNHSKSARGAAHGFGVKVFDGLWGSDKAAFLRPLLAQYSEYRSEAGLSEAVVDVFEEETLPRGVETRCVREVSGKPEPAGVPRPVTDNDLKCYSDRYPDLKTELTDDLAKLWHHWENHGRKEGRNPHCNETEHPLDEEIICCVLDPGEKPICDRRSNDRHLARCYGRKPPTAHALSGPAPIRADSSTPTNIDYWPETAPQKERHEVPRQKVDPQRQSGAKKSGAVGGPAKAGGAMPATRKATSTVSACYITAAPDRAERLYLTVWGVLLCNTLPRDPSMMLDPIIWGLESRMNVNLFLDRMIVVISVHRLGIVTFCVTIILTLRSTLRTEQLVHMPQDRPDL
ncbi:hypothetical protein CYMTET_3472 [Cymbomonas tetramitiformis]|uniref:Uncharacterized protein n=1 Tax=Cymbomonas tetramitiformis TaxID=36881 RepID=A0AAE0H3K4_9CHLO|nr:hypothetical protein CYMTET_3472 [Cymbomonas tetramitiformis]